MTQQRKRKQLLVRYLALSPSGIFLGQQDHSLNQHTDGLRIRAFCVRGGRRGRGVVGVMSELIQKETNQRWCCSSRLECGTCPVINTEISAHNALEDGYLFRQTIAVTGLHVSDPLLEQVHTLRRLLKGLPVQCDGEGLNTYIVYIMCLIKNYDAFSLQFTGHKIGYLVW